MKEFVKLLAEGMLFAGVILLAFTSLAPRLSFRRKSPPSKVLRRDGVVDF
jgi:hypothetical protein